MIDWNNKVAKPQSLRVFTSLFLVPLFVKQHPVTPISEPLSSVSFLGISCQHRSQLVFNFRLLDHVFPHAIEACAGDVAAKPDLIAPWRFAHERDLRHVRPRATVWAARRTDDDFLAVQPNLSA